MDNERLLTVEDVSKALRVTPDTVRRWLRQGRLHGIRPGGDKMGYRIRQSEIDRFLEEADSRPE